MVQYNMDCLNHHDLAHSYFCLNKDDPTAGFDYDASSVFGPTYPAEIQSSKPLSEAEEHLRLRLIVGSHLARHLRHGLELQKGYTSTVGIATTKILSKLVGNVNKPKNQTTIVPPYEPAGGTETSITKFMDHHDIGRIPGIGFKLAQKIRAQVLGRDAQFHEGLVYGGTKESVTVLDVRTSPGMGPQLLEDILTGPGSSRGIGGKVWELIHGIDDSDVGKAKRVPSQISQEDSYMKYLHTFEEVKKQLHLLSERLIRRMHMDLLEDESDQGGEEDGVSRQRWMAHPRTLRLSTRPRSPAGQDQFRVRMSHRISRSAPMPGFVFSLTDTTSMLAQRLVEEALVPMFRKLHHEKAGWNLSLINVAATNMAETATENKDSEGRDIGRMFRRQDDVLKDFRVTAESDSSEDIQPPILEDLDAHTPQDTSTDPRVDCEGADGWEPEDSESQRGQRCDACHNTIPSFAWAAHQRYHELSN